MMRDMMEQCCGTNGKPDFDHMTEFMGQCGKGEFTDDDFDMMKAFCTQEGQPDPEQMKQLFEKCGCQFE